MSELPVLPGFPVSRPRRLRATPALRRLTADVAVTPSGLILPMFVREGVTEPQPIKSMPGMVQHTLDSLTKAAHEAIVHLAIVKVRIGDVGDAYRLLGTPGSLCVRDADRREHR